LRKTLYKQTGNLHHAPCDMVQVSYLTVTMITKTEYELLLRYQDSTELVVDVRKDTIDANGETVETEYVEGFFFDFRSLEKNYADALDTCNELREQYQIDYESDEVFDEAEKLILIKQNKTKQNDD